MSSISSLVVLLATTLTAARPLPLPQSPATETATHVYLRFLAVVRTAKSMDEITPFWGADLMHEFNMMPDADKAGTLDMVKRIESKTTGVKVTNEIRTAAGVTLSLQGTGPDKKRLVGSVDLVKENGVWKLATQEQWRLQARTPEPDPNGTGDPDIER
jgi:hypothetical protein